LRPDEWRRKPRARVFLEEEDALRCKMEDPPNRNSACADKQHSSALITGRRLLDLNPC
jgi:hypothetical protein